jgi:hypothetical protein
MKQPKCIEIVLNYACKRVLKVQTNACNDAILGDLGRFPMHIFQQNVVLSIGYICLIYQEIGM